MDLLDLPPEIFQYIVHNFVSTVGIRRAWNVREVCRTFAVEIQYDVLHSQPLGEDDIPQWSWSTSVRPLPTRYVASIVRYRLNKPLNASPEFLDKLRQMIQFLRDESDVYPQDSPEYLNVLCESLAQRSCTQQLAAALTCKYTALRHRCEDHEDCSDILKDGPLPTHLKIIAAVVIKDSKLVLALLPKLLQTDEWRCEIFGSPLCLAVEHKDTKTVHTILHWLESIYGPDAAAPGYLLGEKQKLEILSAIDRAFVANNLKVLQTLLSFYAHRFGPSGRYTYNGWLCKAYGLANTGYLEAVLAVAKRGREVISREGLVNMTRYAESSHINILVSTKALDIDRDFYKATPLTAAVRSGSLDKIRAILDAGADINSGWFPYSAMGVAFRTKQKQEHKVRIVRLLLERGAMLPATDQWPKAGERGTSQIRALLEAEQKKRKEEI
ncbi:hypothetical protein BKA63DRAFT_569043 [Paraphoma chrysanthemicola]|nr:hypothetical protein BKA63DRAFT_569043 [Paraphoma chrysanthemicola]